jgi:hypothetical protein
VEAVRERLVLAFAGLLLAACAEFVDPGPTLVSLAIAPVFDNTGAFADDADRLKVTIAREDSTDVFTTVASFFVNIDPTTGEADTAIAVPMFQSPTRFRVRLEAVRSSDGAVLFSGESIVSVTAGSSGTGAPVEIPVTYTGPTAARLVLMPSDTAVEAGSSFIFRASTFTAAGGAVNVPVRYALVNAADSVLLRVDRLTGQATVAGGAEGEGLVYAMTPDGLAADTSRVLIGAVPVAVAVNPGYVNVVSGSTAQFGGAVVDALGNPLTVFSVQWTSRSPAVATVSGSGLVTAVALGSAVIYVNAPDFSGNPAFADSVLVTVVPPGNAVVSSVPDARGFRTVAVGDTVVVEVPADMRFTPSELLGSYNATLSWNPAVMRFVDLQQGDFPLPEVNTANTASGELRFAQANANGTGGVFTLARVRFVAQSAGVTQPALTITEMSAARTFTNLIDRVTVTNGTVIVR